METACCLSIPYRKGAVKTTAPLPLSSSPKCWPPEILKPVAIFPPVSSFCTFRDYLILEPLKTSEKCSQSANNGCFRRPLIPSRIGKRPENPRKTASSCVRKSRKVQKPETSREIPPRLPG